MPQIMAEAFVRGLLDKIMVEVLDVIDRDTQNEKSWEQHVDEETDDVESGFVNGGSQAHEYARRNYSKAEEIDLIAKIVRDLRDMRIGDSRYVLPPSLSASEKQVKRAACNVDDVSPADTAAVVAEAQRAPQGQGDTRRMTRAAILELPAEPPARAIRQEDEANEAISVSADLLHQMIEQLENKTGCSEDDAPSASTSKERVAVWEETEERHHVRTIEGNARDILTAAPRSETAGRFRVAELAHDEELRSRSGQHVAAASGEAGLEESRAEKRESVSMSSLKSPRDDAAMEQILPADDAEKRKTLDEATKRRKRGFIGRFRRLIRAAFGRRKN